MYTPTSGCVRLGGDAGWSGGLIRARVWWWVQLRRRCGQVVGLDRIVMLSIRLGYHRMQFSASHLGPLGCWFPLIMYHHSQAFLRCSGVLRPCSWLGACVLRVRVFACEQDTPVVLGRKCAAPRFSARFAFSTSHGCMQMQILHMHAALVEY